MNLDALTDEACMDLLVALLTGSRACKTEEARRVLLDLRHTVLLEVERRVGIVRPVDDTGVTR